MKIPGLRGLHAGRLLADAVKAFIDAAMASVTGVLEQLRQPRGGLLSAGAIVALWTASAGVRATMNAFNVAYGVQETRPVWVRYPLSIFYTLAVAALLILSAALLLIGPRAMQWMANYLGFEQFFVTAWTWLRWPAAIVLLSLSAALIYYSAPAAQPKFPLVTPGAVVSVLLWVVASIVFNYYALNFADYGAMYGSIGSVVALMFYFFISSAVLLFGAEINAVIERHARLATHDPAPLGLRSRIAHGKIQFRE